MLSVSLPKANGARLKLLCLGAHSDDIEIGCGGTILSLLGARTDVEVRWVVFGAIGERVQEARASAADFLKGAARAEIEIHDFRDGFFPYREEIKKRIEALKTFDPDVIFTHRGVDRHQDHRLLSELTWNTFRRHFVLEYEIPKYDGDLGNPNVFVPLDADTRGRKVELLMQHFETQRSRSWFTPETFDGLMRLRGIESAASTGFAEGFYVRKLTLDPREGA